MTSISLSPAVDVLVVTEVGFVEKKAIYGKVSQEFGQANTAPNKYLRQHHNSHTFQLFQPFDLRHVAELALTPLTDS